LLGAAHGANFDYTTTVRISGSYIASLKYTMQVFEEFQIGL
jgi:hypothetical protein